MGVQHPDNNITRALDSEVRGFTRGGWAWIAFSLIAQYALLLWFGRPQLMQTSTAVFFGVFSLLFALWPLVRGLRQVWRARRMKQPDDLLRRALTTEPQLVAWVKLGTHTTIWTKLYNLVFTILFTAADALKNSSDQYGVTGHGETANNRLPCVVVKLTNGQEHRLTATSDDEKLKELISALLAYAPHAVPPPEPISTKGHWVIEVATKGTMRPVMFMIGTPLMLICSILLFAQYMNARECREFEQRGVKTTATISRLSDYGGEGSTYNVAVDFNDRNGKNISASTVKLVAKPEYDSLKIGAPVEIIYNQDQAQEFRLVASLERLRASNTVQIVLALLSLVGFVMILTGLISVMMTKKMASGVVGAGAAGHRRTRGVHSGATSGGVSSVSPHEVS